MSWIRTAAVVVGWGAAVGLLTRPAIGVVAGLMAGFGVRAKAGRLFCRLAALAFLAALPMYYVVQQSRHHYWPDIKWPADLSSANDIAWLALALLGSDLLVGAVYARRSMQGVS